MRQAPTVQIFRGPEAAVRSAVLDHTAGEPRPLVIPGWSDLSRSWAGIRHLLAQCLEGLGEDDFLAALDRHPGLARLVLDRWRPGSPESADPQAAAIGARIESHLTHNWAVQRPAMSGWARLLADLLRDRDVCLVVPQVQGLDWESLAALKCLFRQPRRSWPRLVLGYDDGRLEPELDPQGIEWRTSPDYVREAMLGFAALPGVRCCETAGSQTPDPGIADRLSAPLPPLVQGLEETAGGLLADRHTPNDAGCRQVVEAMEACFRRFSFTAALRLGCELFRRTPGLRGQPAARAHGIVALAAHNRQFRSQGNLTLARFLTGHLEAAFEEESRPQVRCALLYRLAVAYGRRLGELETAGRWARRAVAEAAALENGAANEPIEGHGPGYQGAWGYNILAYVHVRSKDSEGSRRSMQAAADHAQDRGWPIDRERSRRSSLFGDLALTRSLAVHNLAIAEAMCGELETAAQTLQKACLLESEIEGSAKYWAQNLVKNLRLRRRPDLALCHGRAGLEAALRDREASLQLFFQLQLADLSFRVGDAVASARHFLSARRLAARMRRIADEYPDTDFPTAAALERAGNVERAQTLLRSKLRESGDPPQVLVAEAASRLALLAARRGDREAAERWASQASDAAAEDAHRHCLVRTAVHLGQAARLLDRKGDATDLLRWAWGLVETREDPHSVAAADELRLLVELDRCGGLPPERIPRCFELVPEALDAASSWWLLADLLRLLLDQGPPTDSDGDGVPTEAARTAALQTLVTAAEAREDCRPLLPAARERLGARHPPHEIRPRTSSS